MNIGYIKQVAKRRPLTPKEQAILLLWNQTHGHFSNNNKSIVEAVLNFKNVYSDEELQVLLRSSEDEDTDFQYWETFISDTQKYDLVSYSYFQKTLSLVNELPLFLWNNESKLIYSITLGKEINHEDLFSEMCDSFKNYYQFLISVLINQYFLSSAFDNSNDLQTIKTLRILYEIRNHNDEIRVNNIAILLDVVPFVTDKFINQYLTILQNRSLFKNDDIFSHENKIRDHIKKTINQYHPKMFIIEPEIEPIFE